MSVAEVAMYQEKAGDILDGPAWAEKMAIHKRPGGMTRRRNVPAAVKLAERRRAYAKRRKALAAGQ